MGLIRILLFITIAYFAIRMLRKIFSVFLSANSNRNSSQRAPGSDSMKGNKRKKGNDDQLGEYVDYEDVKD